MKHTYFFIVVLFVAGFLLRMYFTSLATKNIEWDALEYYQFGTRIVQGVHKADCCHINPGYPLMLAAIIKIARANAVGVVHVVQALIEIATAFLLYRISRRVFKPQAVAVIIAFAYLVNPFTASYTGLILSEITVLFTIVLTGYIFVAANWKFSRSSAFALGAALGLAVLVKMSLYHFCLILMTVAGIAMIRDKKIYLVACMATGFFIVSLYTIYIGYRTYGVFSVLPPYNNDIAGRIYISKTMSRAGEMQGEPVTIQPEYTTYINEYYHYFNNDPKQIKELNARYTTLLIYDFSKNWHMYLGHWVFNNIWMWDKYHLFIYNDPFYPSDTVPLRVINIILLAMHAAGLTLFILKDPRERLKHPLVVYTLLLFAYVAGGYPLENSETRLSLQYYPLVFLWAGYGVYRISTSIHPATSRGSSGNNSIHRKFKI